MKVYLNFPLFWISYGNLCFSEIFPVLSSKTHWCRCVHTYKLGHSVVSNSAAPWTIACQAPLSLFPGINIGVGSHFYGIFPTQGLNLCLLCLLHWQSDSLPLRRLGSPIIYYIFTYIFNLCEYDFYFILDTNNLSLCLILN